MLKTIAAIAMTALPLCASARTLTIALDLSGSNPLIADERFARVVAEHAENLILSLEPGDYVYIRTFGAPSLDNMGARGGRLDRQHTAQEAAAGVAAFIRSIPSKGIDGQASTNILGFLEFTEFGCDGGGIVAIYSDGVEASEYISAQALLGGQALPEPESGLLTGCRVVMFGLGAAVNGSLPPPKVKALRDAWRVWMEKAGAEPFEPVINP